METPVVEMDRFEEMRSLCGEILATLRVNILRKTIKVTAPDKSIPDEEAMKYLESMLEGWYIRWTKI